MSIFRDEDEKEYVVAQLCNKGMYRDLGNFFVLYNELTTEDIFEYRYTTPDKFYIKLFDYVFSFLEKSLKDETYTRYAGNILGNIYLDEFYTIGKIDKKYYKNRDAIISLFIKELLLYMAMNDYRAELTFSISCIIDNENIPQDVFKDLIKSESRFNSAFVVEELVDSCILSIPELLEIIESRFEETTNEDILELFRKLYTTEEHLIDMLTVVKSKYHFIEKKDSRVVVKPKLKGKSKRFFELVRGFLTETIISEAEVDIWDYAQTGEQTYVTTKGLSHLILYTKLKEYLGSEERRRCMVNLFNKHGHEEWSNLFNYDETCSLNQEITTIKYVYDLDTLPPFKFFIRLFNINRFGFLSYDRAISEIRSLMKERVFDVGVDMLYAAIDKDTYNLLVNY